MVDRAMRTLTFIALAVAACAFSPLPVQQQQGLPPELVGRAAGPPEHCVSIESLETLRISEDPHVLLYGSGKTIWANPLPGQCSFRTDDILVTERHGPLYCRGDFVRSLGRESKIPGPGCALGDFIPYKRA